jgi:sulfopyruvate decarboxylase subunit alpha
VSNEAIGVGVCAGAWLSGRRPALLVPTSGLLVAAWPLTSLCMAWGLPLLLLIPFRGDIGDAFWLMGPYKDTTEPLLGVLHIPHVVVSKTEEIAKAIVDAQGSTISWQRPVAVLLTGETIK